MTHSICDPFTQCMGKQGIPPQTVVSPDNEGALIAWVHTVQGLPIYLQRGSILLKCAAID